jgi:pimeloyl-ACP methyl ester carboxylesterase
VPKLPRDDGVEIHWEERGEGGPLVVLTAHTFAYPDVLEDLIADLASDHRLVTYDARGTGGSSRRGPYDLLTDKADLQALIEELSPPAVSLAWGESGHRAILLANERPDLVPFVVVMGGGGGVVRPQEAATTEALAGSDAVREAFGEMLRNDYRGALRHIISSTSPQLSDEELRERVERGVEYCSQEAAIARFDTWLQADELAAIAEGLGHRLRVIQFPTLWFARETIDMVRERLPRAHVHALDDTEGPISRPDITAGIVREATEPLRERK